MQLLKRNRERESRQVLELPVASIVPNPAQPRVRFDEEGLAELAESIRRHGVLQPLTVRRRGGSYELVAGERRLRAARMAGLSGVPCLVAEVDDEESAVLALIENLQRRDLNYMEEAAAFRKLMETYGFSQEKTAEKLGKSQSAVANKLRLLKLSPECARLLLENGLTERHARALLRLPDEERRLSALHVIIAKQMNVARAEDYIEGLLKVPVKKRRPSLIVKDVRLFLNTIDHSMEIMRRAGVEAECGREETEEGITLTISIPKAKVRSV